MKHSDASDSLAVKDEAMVLIYIVGNNRKIKQNHKDDKCKILEWGVKLKTILLVLKANYYLEVPLSVLNGKQLLNGSFLVI